MELWKSCSQKHPWRARSASVPTERRIFSPPQKCRPPSHASGARFQWTMRRSECFPQAGAMSGWAGRGCLRAISPISGSIRSGGMGRCWREDFALFGMRFSRKGNGLDTCSGAQSTGLEFFAQRARRTPGIPSRRSLCELASSAPKAPETSSQGSCRGCVRSPGDANSSR